MLLGRGKGFASMQRAMTPVAIAVVVALSVNALTNAFAVPSSGPDRLPALREAGTSSLPTLSLINRRSQFQDGDHDGSPGWSTAGRAMAAMALCVFVSSAADKAARQRRVVGTGRRAWVPWKWVPSTHFWRPEDRQRTMRRLERFGQIPAFCNTPLLERVAPGQKNFTMRPMDARYRGLVEKQRLRCHYNIGDKLLRLYYTRSMEKGIEYPLDTLMQICEGRLDNICWRLGLGDCMADSRAFVSGQNLEWRSAKMDEWLVIHKPSSRLRVGDVIRVRDRESSQALAKHKLNQEGRVKIPEHLRWDAESLECQVLGVCDPNEFGIHIDQGHIFKYFAFAWVKKNRNALHLKLKKIHRRYVPGTRVEIRKPNTQYNKKLPRPTPENLLNMKRGIGLNDKGVNRPPCLWGRKMPLNSPYPTLK